MLAKFSQRTSALTAADVKRFPHILCVLPFSKTLPRDVEIPGLATLTTLLKRRAMKFDELSTTPLSGEIEQGALAAWVAIDSGKSLFAKHSRCYWQKTSIGLPSLSTAPLLFATMSRGSRCMPPM